MMGKEIFPIVSYAVQACGPVPSGLMLDNGPALLASYLLNGGYTPKIFDFNNLRTIEEIERHGKEIFLQNTIDFLDDYYRSNQIKIAGTKVYANGFVDNVRIHKELKRRNPDLLIIAGGPQVEWFGEEIFKYSDAFGLLSYGDGDSAIVPLADFIYGSGNIYDIPNLIYRQNGQTKRTKRKNINMDDLPDPIYSKEVYHDVDSKIHISPREDSRGCPYGKCGFCVHPRIGGKRRVRSVEQLAQEIETSEMKVSRLSGPSPLPGYISTLAKLIPGKKISAFTYSNSGYDYAEISKCLMGAFIGLESTDKHILENVLKKTNNKDQYLKNANEMVQEFKKKGIATIVSMMVPCPGETQSTIKRSIEYLVDMQPDFVVTMPLFPIPGTPITKSAKRDSEFTRVLLDKDFERKWIQYELDLLQKSDEWPEPPFKIKIDGEYVNPFLTTMKFTAELMKNGIYPLSDEIVLMSYLYHNGLSADQKERRIQCNEFMAGLRDDIANSNSAEIREKVKKINKNQLGKNNVSRNHSQLVSWKSE